jgi:hypothetical protein
MKAPTPPNVVEVVRPAVPPRGFATAIVRIHNYVDHDQDTPPGAAPVRWLYRVQVARHTTTGPDGADHDHPIAFTGQLFRAYNTFETANTRGGVTGHGVNLANLPPGFFLLPIPVGAVVPAWQVGGSWWFAVPNAVDGTC